MNESELWGHKATMDKVVAETMARASKGVHVYLIDDGVMMSGQDLTEGAIRTAVKPMVICFPNTRLYFSKDSYESRFYGLDAMTWLPEHVVTEFLDATRYPSELDRISELIRMMGQYGMHEHLGILRGALTTLIGEIDAYGVATDGN